MDGKYESSIFMRGSARLLHKNSSEKHIYAKKRVRIM